MSKMKAISLWQPWASAMTTGAKTIETRPWKTNYRGNMVICSAKKKVMSDLNFYLSTWSFQGGLGPLVGEPLVLGEGKSWSAVKVHHLPFGMALAIGELIDCISTHDFTLGQIETNKPFGNFSTGRYGWIFKNIHKIVKPFPIIGRQRLFNIELPSGLKLEKIT